MAACCCLFHALAYADLPVCALTLLKPGPLPPPSDSRPLVSSGWHPGDELVEVKGGSRIDKTHSARNVGESEFRELLIEKKLQA